MFPAVQALQRFVDTAVRVVGDLLTSFPPRLIAVEEFQAAEDGADPGAALGVGECRHEGFVFRGVLEGAHGFAEDEFAGGVEDLVVVSVFMIYRRVVMTKAVRPLYLPAF